MGAAQRSGVKSRYGRERRGMEGRKELSNKGCNDEKKARGRGKMGESERH